MATKQARYRVYFTPLLRNDGSTYNTEIDVSDRVELTGIGNIKRSLDSTDYEIGIYVFSDITIVGANQDGYFNDQEDKRSIFKSTRDRCKVRVVFEEIEITRNGSGIITGIVTTSTVTFNGLINEEATRIDPVNDTITFKVLSRDSVLRTTNVQAGSITAGTSFKSAMQNILNQPKITSVLGFSVLNINPSLNLTVDNGTVFDNMPVQEAMKLLLIASNSVMYIDASNNIIVKDRTETDDKPVVNFYGKSDQYGRENIINIKSFNTGIHRNFTSVKVNDAEETDNALAQTFGYRRKEIDLDFITDDGKEADIAEELLDWFKVPKMEMVIEVAMRHSKNVDLLDRISVNYPLRAKPIDGKFLPIVGATKLGDGNMPLPRIFGSISIMPRIAWKVIEITEKPKDMTREIKLRQVGKELGDGIFDIPESCVLGFAKLGSGIICEGGDPCDTFNPSVIGAAKLGCTILG